MVLVDTSVWIAHLRHPDKRLGTLLTDSGVMVHDFIIGELACGNLKPREEILALLKFLPQSPVSSQEEILAFIENNSLYGRGLSFVDIHLLASAKLADVSFWTLDQRLAQAATKLKINA